MNGNSGMNMIMGMLLARELGQREQVMAGLAAAQMRNPWAVLFLKPQLDLTVEKEKAVKLADAKIQQMEVELKAAVKEGDINAEAEERFKRRFANLWGREDSNDT